MARPIEILFGESIKIEGLETASRRLDRAGNRLALALVTLGLYVAASLLMQNALALWFTFRVAAAFSG